MYPLWIQPKPGPPGFRVLSTEFSMAARVASVVDDSPDAVVGECVNNSQGIALLLRVHSCACNYCHLCRGYGRHNRWPICYHVIDARSKQSTNMFAMAAILQLPSSIRLDSSAINAAAFFTIATSKGVSPTTLLSKIASPSPTSRKLSRSFSAKV